MEFSKELSNAIENAGFSIREDDDNNEIEFEIYSNYGQDFIIIVEKGDSLEELATNIFEYYESFDVSQQAYLWLDEFGHGKNGAPYDMKDVYEDMEECEGSILKLYEVVKEFSYEV